SSIGVGDGDMRGIRRSVPAVQSQGCSVLRIGPGVCSVISWLRTRMESSPQGEMVAAQMVEAREKGVMRRRGPQGSDCPLLATKQSRIINPSWSAHGGNVLQNSTKGRRHAIIESWRRDF